MDTLALLGSTFGLGLLSGIRLYSTVLAVGLGVRFGLINLHPALSHLNVLTHPLILTVAAIIFLVEFNNSNRLQSIHLTKEENLCVTRKFSTVSRQSWRG